MDHRRPPAAALTRTSRTAHDLPEGIHEDPAIRGARFVARFGLAVEDTTPPQCMPAACSTERRTRADEFRRRLHSASVQVALFTCCTKSVRWRRGCRTERCVGVAQNEYHPDDVYWHC
jgi:hypothetical protein